MSNDSISDDELEAILGDVSDETTEESLPDAEEPEDEEIQEIDEDLGAIAEDAPGVSPEDVNGGSTGSSSTNGETETTDKTETAGDDPDDFEEEFPEVDDEISLDDFQGDTTAPEPDSSGGTPLEGVQTINDDEERREEMMNKANKAGATKQEAADGLRVLDEIEKNEEIKSQIGFNQADNIKAVIDNKMWETFNHGSFGEFFEANDFGMSQSSAYRYRNVALFMDEFPLGEEDWDNQFYQESGIPKKEVVNADTGEIDEERTRRANNLQNRLNFTDVKDIASLFNNGHIDYAKAKELLKKSIILNGEEFDEELDMEKNDKDSTVTEELTDRGLVGPTFVVNAQNEEKAAQKMRELADDIENGKRYSRQVLDGDESIEDLGSKSVSFHEFQDGTIVGDI